MARHARDNAPFNSLARDVEQRASELRWLLLEAENLVRKSDGG